MMNFWPTIVLVLLRVIEWWIKKQENNSDSLKLFYQFVHKTNINHMWSTSAFLDWRDQVRKLSEKV